MNIFIGWLLDALRAIGRRSAYWTLRYGSSMFNIGCKGTIIFANTQILVYLCKIFKKNQKVL
jgi:hypothetical protein